MRNWYRSLIMVLGLAVGASACGSTRSATGGDDDKQTNGGDDRVAGDPGAKDPGFSDDDFTKREIEEVKAPVYLDGIDPAAQDAFREGVRTVSTSRPDFKTAEKKFKEAAEKAPDFLEAYFDWGQALERQGKGDEALGVYQKALDKNPGDASATAYIAKIYLGKARAAKFLGQAAEAESWMQKAKGLLDQLVAKEPTNVQVNNALALYHLMKEDVDTAERFVKEVLYVEPTNVTGLNTRGLINLKRGKLLLAKWIFENKVLKEDPTSTEAHTNLGYTYIKLDLRPLAMKHFQQALEFDPENMEVRMNIAAMLLEHLDYKSALGHYEKVLQAQPNNLEAKIGRCDAMFGLGGTAADKSKQFESALGCYDAYVKEKPDRADLYKRIAETYQNKLQNLEKAVEYYELYAKKGKLDAKEAEQNQKVITTLKDIISKGGLKAMMPDEPLPEEAPPEGQPAPEGGNP
ncbi:MAG: tetratricopeptide repeat protein [Deltaproteobacteria bacterium]|nr:tetratricopeptide repeat protein [Deltaproteobacteria bacterium]